MSEDSKKVKSEDGVHRERKEREQSRELLKGIRPPLICNLVPGFILNVECVIGGKSSLCH